MSVILIGVSSRSHHGDDHLSLRRSEDQDFVRRSEALEESDDEELLQQIDELDTMIKLARNARSIKTDEDPDNMVADDEIIKVMDSIDLTSTDNVEVVSEVLKTLPGDVQLEFLMTKFMMKDAKVKEEIMHSKTRSASKSKRSTFSRSFSQAEPEPEYSAFSRDLSHAEPEPEYSYYKQFSNAFSHAEPEPEPRYRRSPADHHEGPKSILLQRSADIHGFSEDLDAIQGQGQGAGEKKGKVVERLVDMLGKNRKRRSSEDQDQDLSSLPRKKPFAHVDLDF